MWVETTRTTRGSDNDVEIRVVSNMVKGSPSYRVEIRIGHSLMNIVGFSLQTRVAVARGIGSRSGLVVIYPHEDGFIIRSKNPTYSYKGQGYRWGYIRFAAQKWNLSVINGGYPWEKISKVEVLDRVDGLELPDGCKAIQGIIPARYIPYKEKRG